VLRDMSGGLGFHVSVLCWCYHYSVHVQPEELGNFVVVIKQQGICIVRCNFVLSALCAR
jgi:hypothetical protein